MFGVGAPTALQIIVASLPSKAVTFCGGCSIIGVDASVCGEKSGLRSETIWKKNLNKKGKPSHKMLHEKMGLVHTIENSFLKS